MVRVSLDVPGKGVPFETIRSRFLVTEAAGVR